eukprot:TRINITY_DN3069_c0_g4_i6.p1 TRINITY_DN3069_c0_g4~~TRINITY_DN3069_c0_g4_i6.p1  ORF type:complete len:109 (+),score=0.26 TRINITY_DN3069_c0_g4_i6:73-399(+)
MCIRDSLIYCIYPLKALLWNCCINEIWWSNLNSKSFEDIANASVSYQISVCIMPIACGEHSLMLAGSLKNLISTFVRSFSFIVIGVQSINYLYFACIDAHTRNLIHCC